MESKESKLKPVNTKDPVDFRAHLEEFNQIMRLHGNELSDQEVSRMVELHCEHGLSLDECVERMMQE